MSYCRHVGRRVKGYGEMSERLLERLTYPLTDVAAITSRPLSGLVPLSAGRSRATDRSGDALTTKAECGGNDIL